MGKKSVEEVQFWIKNLPSGIGAYTLMDSCDDSDHGDNNQTSSVTKAVVFLSETGAVVDDIPIEKTPLSVRAKNSLTHDGILFTSQLVGKTVQDLLPLKNMGRKTAEEILNYLTKVMVTYTSEEGNVEQDKSSCQNAIVSELLASYGQTESTWSKELLAIQEQYPEAVGEALVFHELVVHAFVGSLGLGGLGLLFLDNQSEVGVGSHLGGQFFILRTETLVGLVEACLGASDGLVEEVQGEADSGLGRSNDSIHNNFLSWLFGLCGRSQPLFSFF